MVTYHIRQDVVRPAIHPMHHVDRGCCREEVPGRIPGSANAMLRTGEDSPGLPSWRRRCEKRGLLAPTAVMPMGSVVTRMSLKSTGTPCSALLVLTGSRATTTPIDISLNLFQNSMVFSPALDRHLFLLVRVFNC